MKRFTHLLPTFLKSGCDFVLELKSYPNICKHVIINETWSVKHANVAWYMVKQKTTNDHIDSIWQLQPLFGYNKHYLQNTGMEKSQKSHKKVFCTWLGSVVI